MKILVLLALLALSLVECKNLAKEAGNDIANDIAKDVSKDVKRSVAKKVALDFLTHKRSTGTRTKRGSPCLFFGSE